MGGLVSGRKGCCSSSASLVVLGLCLGSFLVASAELPFLQPLQHGGVPEPTRKQGTQHHHWLRLFFRDHMPWSPSGSGNVNHERHRFVHAYRPRLYMTANHAANCERKIRPEHGVGHRFHLRGTPSGNQTPVNSIVCFLLQGAPSTPKSVDLVNAKPIPGGHLTSSAST